MGHRYQPERILGYGVLLFKAKREVITDAWKRHLAHSAHPSGNFPGGPTRHMGAVASVKIRVKLRNLNATQSSDMATGIVPYAQI